MTKRILLLILFQLQVAALSAQLSLSTSATQNTNCRGVDCVYSGPSILINEIMLSPTDGLDGSLWQDDDTRQGEWIELFNPDPCRSIDISCFYLGNAATDASLYPGGFRIPDNTIVPPLGFVIIRGKRAAPVPANLLIQNGGNTIEIVPTKANVCIGNGTRLWFPNLGGWFAFYNRDGVVQDAINFGGDNQPDLAGLPCIASNTGCPNLPGNSLQSFNAIAANRKTKIANNVTANSNMTYKRMPDGGAWVTNTETAPRYGTCNGACLPVPPLTCNGTVSVVVTGGTPPYKYLWNDNRGQNKATATQLCAGSYCVTVTDAQGRTANACGTVTDFKPTVTITKIPNGCIDGPNTPVVGTPTNGVNKGVGIFTGPINSGVFSPAGAGAGKHTLIYSYTDSAGCKNADTTKVEIFPLPNTKANTDKSIICLGDSVRLHGTGAKTYAWNKGVIDSVKFAPKTTELYTVIGTDTNGCRKLDSVKVEVSPVSFAGLDTAVISCPDNTLSIRGLLRQNQLDGKFAKKGNFQGNLNTTSGDFIIPAAMPVGKYRIYYIATPVAPCPPDTAEIEIEIKGKPRITNIKQVCSVDRKTYTVTFTISDGDSTSYTVSPPGGTISSTFPYLYTSIPVSSGTSEIFTVNDQFMCGDAITSTFLDCSCTTFAGTMKNTPQDVCGPNSIDCKPFFNKDSVNDGNDRFKFYLHTSSGQTIIGAIDSNITGIFSFDASRMQYGVSYYVSPVMGDNISGNINFNDVCLSVGRGLEVVWREIPQLSILNDTILCRGSNYYLKFNFSKGTAPFVVQLGENSTSGTINGAVTINNSLDSILFNPLVSTTYTAISYIDKYGCVGQIGKGLVTVKADNPTIATLLSGTGLCSDGVSNFPMLRINLQGDSSTYRVVLSNTLLSTKDTLTVTKPGLSFPATLYDPNKAITFLLDTVLGNYTPTCPPQVVGQVTIYPLPSVQIAGDSIYCEGDDVKLKLKITGVGPWDIYANDNQNGAYNFFTYQNRDTTHTVQNLAPGQYVFKVDSIIDRASTCFGIGGTTQALVTVNPAPRVKLFVLANGVLRKNISYCVGNGPVTLRVDTLPDPLQSYTVRYSAIGNPNKIYPLLSLTRANNTFQFDTLTPGTYRIWLENAKDNTPAACGGIGDTVTIVVNPLPTLTLSAIDTIICVGDSALISATVTGNPLIRFALNETSGKDNTTYNPSGTGTFSFYVTPSQSGYVNYLASLLRDGSTPQCSNTTNAQVRFRVVQPPTADNVGTGEWCEGTPFTMPVTVTGESAITVNFNINGLSRSKTFPLSGDTLNGLLPPSATNYMATITSVRDNTPAQCVGTFQTPFTITIRPTPTASLVFNPNPVCLNEAVEVLVSATGNGPFEVDLLNDLNVPRTLIVNGTGIINETARFGLRYRIVSVRDNSKPNGGGTCFNNAQSNYPLTVNSLPTVTLTGDTQVCPGTKANLQFKFGNGKSPYSLFYTDAIRNDSAIVNADLFDTTRSITKTILLRITELRDANLCKAPLLDSLAIKLLPLPEPNIQATAYESCPPLTTRLINNTTNVVLSSASFSSFGNSANQLGDTLNTWNFSNPGAYDLTGTLVSEFACIRTFTIPNFFLVNPNPIANFTYNPMPVTTSDHIINFINQSVRGNTYRWNLSDSAGTLNEPFTMTNPRYEYKGPEENILRMNLHVTSNKGCVDSTFEFIRVLPDLILYVPSAFTPNSDGANDVFLPIFSIPGLVRNYELLIFNRWGELIFQTTDFRQHWDGTYNGQICQMEVYTWEIRYGVVRKAEKKRLFGKITLLK